MGKAPQVVPREAILRALGRRGAETLRRRIEEGYVAYSAGRAVVPPVGELLVPEREGEIHIKYGYIADHAHYVIKIASGFYGNPARGLPSGDGLVLVFSQVTGELEAILLDGGYLTQVRTALAGAVAARCLGPAVVERIGILGTGEQARFQLRYLEHVTPCRDVVLWGRRRERAVALRDEMKGEGFIVEVAESPGDVAAACRLLVTTTTSTAPLLRAGDIRPGTHITAIGSDTPEKQELDPDLLARASLVVTDSRAQSRTRGEIARAVAAGRLSSVDRCPEIGELLAGRHPGRTSPEAITIADFTGVAVQDIQIATAVLEELAGGQTP